jgi:hypothetical protein
MLKRISQKKQDFLDYDRFLAYIITVSCFGIILVIGFGVAFYPEAKPINTDPYMKESKRDLPIGDQFGWDTASGIIEGTSVSLINILSSYYRNDLLLWDLKADRMTNGKIPGSMKCIMVKLKDYQHGSGNTEMWAEEAVLDTKGRQVVMTGDVNVINKGDYKFFTEQLVWSEKSGRIETKLPWTLIYPNKGTLQGEGGSFDLEFKNPKFYKLKTIGKSK